MDKLLPLIPHNSFDPEEIHELTVAYQNVCAAVENGRPSPDQRERVAHLIVNMAIAGQLKSTELYLGCLKRYRNDTSIEVMEHTL